MIPLKRSLSDDENMSLLNHDLEEKSYSPQRYDVVVNIYFNKNIKQALRQQMKNMMLNKYQFIPTPYLIDTPNTELSVFKDENCYHVLTNVDNNGLIENLFTMLWLNTDGCEIDTPVIESVLKRDYTAYLKYAEDVIDNVIKKEEEKVRSEFGSRLKEMFSQAARKNSVDSEIININDRIESLYSQLADAQRKKKELCVRAQHYKDMFDEDMFNDMLACIDMHSIYGIRYYDNNTIQFVIKTKLLYWEESDYTILRDNRNKNRNTLTDLSDYMIKLLDYIFVDKKYTLLLDTPVVLNLRGNNPVNMYISFERGDTGSVDQKMISNPHIKHYNCWGDNSKLLQESLNNKDYVTFWGTLLSTFSGVNLSDSPVFRKFIEDIVYAADYDNAVQLVDNETNTGLSLKDALRLIKEENE